MKAVVYHGAGKRAWEEVPDPTILEPTDVIARVDTTTICGTDLHILKGDVPEVEEGRILGHEAIGTITEVGSAVTDLKLATASLFRRSRTAASAHTVRTISPHTARPWAVSAGFSGT